MATIKPCGVVCLGFRLRRRQQCLVRATASDSEKDELAAKLAAAEAEAQALRKELAERKEVDLSKLKPRVPEKRIDGTGYRETILTVPVEGQKPDEWGLTEANLQEQDEKSKAEEEENAVVARRLVIGIGLSAAAIGLSFFKPPPGLIKPAKPLLFYVVRILQLKQQLLDLEESSSDSKTVLSQMERIAKSAGDWKDTFLSAAAWLDGAAADKASSLAYQIYDYLEQAEYNKYFDPIGKPSEAERLEFIRFSLQATKAARDLIQEFLSNVPKDVLREANINQTALSQ